MANAGETEVRLTFAGQGIVMLPRKKVLKSEELCTGQVNVELAQSPPRRKDP